MSQSIHRYLTSVSFAIYIRRIGTVLAFFSIFPAPIHASYQQTTEYLDLRRAGRAEYLAGNFEKAEALLRSALEGEEQPESIQKIDDSQPADHQPN